MSRTTGIGNTTPRVPERSILAELERGKIEFESLL